MSPIGIPRIFGGFATREYMMDYIPGIAIGEFIESCDAEELRVIQDQVLNYLERTSRDSQQDLETDILLEFVENKLNRCLVSLSGNWLAKKLQIQKDALILSYGERKYGKRWSHGDFSFENLLVSQSLTVSAIDFLESEISIIEIDWGRIWLDLKFGWWAYSNHRTTNGEINRAKFESSLEGKAKELGLPRRELNKFALLAALRVLPYSRRPLRRGHIAFTINNLIDSILK
jgi:hypothetical protein